MTSASDNLIYCNPPVVQRTFTLLADIPDTYFERESEFKERLKEHYPVYEPRKHWHVELIEKQGRPDLTSTVTLGHSLYKKDNRGDRLLGIEYDQGKLVFTLLRTKDETHLFERLRDQIHEWVPFWWTLFDIRPESVKVALLEYANLISMSTTPSFFDEKGGINVGRVLTVFAGIPGNNHQAMVPPYDCQVGLAIDTEQRIYCNLRVSGIAENSGRPAIRVDLQARREQKERLSLKDCLDAADQLHSVVLEQFNNIFTSQAKESFNQPHS